MEKTIYKKLAEAKKEIGKISKDSTNPFFNSAYFDINSLLEHVEPILEKHGLMITQPIYNGMVRTEIRESISDGSMGVLVSELKLPELTDPQKLGSCITYYRRYTLQSLLALQSEDDDANLASKKTKTTNKNSNNEDKKWLNKFESDKKTLTRDWNRAVATLKEGQSINYLRELFKVSKESAVELETYL